MAGRRGQASLDISRGLKRRPVALHLSGWKAPLSPSHAPIGREMSETRRRLARLRVVRIELAKAFDHQSAAAVLAGLREFALIVKLEYEAVGVVVTLAVLELGVRLHFQNHRAAFSHELDDLHMDRLFEERRLGNRRRCE